MYLPAHFRQEDSEALHECVARYPLATVVTLGPEGLEANPIPLRHDPTPLPDAPHGRLIGHMSRANRQWQRFDANVEALAIFQGPNAYVTPSWYPSKAEHGKAVPTWNYAVVQARGRLSFFDDPNRLRQVLADLTAGHESPRPHPWTLDDAPQDYIAGQLKAIVGIEIAVRELTGKWKMSQNRSAPDRHGVASGLAQGDATERVVSTMIAREEK